MEATTQRISTLTPAERRKLQQTILGYGKLADASKKCEVHRHTLRNIARAGHGKPEIIERLRATIL